MVGNPFKDETRITIRIRFVVLIFGLLLTAVFALLVWLEPSSSWNDLFLSIAAGIGLTSLVYQAINTRLYIELRNESLRLEQKKNAMYLIEATNTKEMSEAILTGVKLREELQIEAAGVNTIEEKMGIKENKHAIILIFNFYERLALAVQNDYANEEILKEYFQTSMKRYWDLFNGWITKSRREWNDDTLLIEFENIKNKWTTTR